MKRLPSMSLVVALAATVSACDTDPGAKVVQRDVYSGPMALENCTADWGNEELCKQRLDEAETKRMAAAGHGGGGSHGSVMPLFIYGPGYVGGVREVTHNGRTITPMTQRAVQTAQFSPSTFKPTGYTAPKPPGSAVARGGWGSTGRAVSGGGAS